ncbi:MAG: WD40-like Beta Propeller Repeat protein [Bacteroidota bacterium]|nr:WD40-like Beta Propeller Repeat protein [Bacteroidota bacterium]
MIPLLTAAQEKPPSIYKITKMSFNSSVFSDISPVIVKDGIVFCSDKRFSGPKDRTTFEGRRLYNIYIAERKDTSDWQKPQEIKSERSTLFNNGPLCFAPDGKTVYFTSDVETGKATKKRNFKNHSGIFIADLEGTNLVALRPFAYNNPQYDLGHPSMSNDGKYLFFASSMPGGQGGSDIFYCEWINGQWSTPVNLGPKVNSPGSENYPFIHPSGKLYFSSDRPGGNGRLDVYSTILSLGRWEAPVLMPDPINSSSDDFAFVADDNLQTGYFSSNRQRNDDIYQFTSTIIRKATCDTLVENNYCYQMIEENAVKFDTLPFRYEWKFGDGEKGIGPSVVHCYSGPGSYLVQLDVVNLITNEVLFNEKTYNLDIINVEQPYISGPDEGVAKQNIRFTADETNLPGWNISRYYWNFGDETIAIGKEVDKTYLQPGVYNIQLIVTAEPEPDGVVREACVCKNIIIEPQP